MEDGREICLQNEAGRHEKKRRLGVAWRDQDGICPRCNLEMRLIESQFERQYFQEGIENKVPLCALAGVAGFRSLLSRALTLARAEAPSLSAVQVAADGSLQGLDELRPRVDADQAGEAGIILIIQLLGLLVRVVGEATTLQMVTSEILPDFKFASKSVIPMGFEAIVNEVDDLQGVGARLERLAEQYPPVTDALRSISGNVLNTATVLAVVAAIKSPKPN